MAHYHFVGILGCGMRALVEILLQRGEKVTGSDSNYVSNASFSKPVEINTNASKHSKKCNYLIYSTAISEDHPDLQIAKSNNIPCLHRSELIQNIMKNTPSILLLLELMVKRLRAQLFRLFLNNVILILRMQLVEVLLIFHSRSTLKITLLYF